MPRGSNFVVQSRNLSEHNALIQDQYSISCDIQMHFKERRNLGGGYVDTLDLLFYILIHSVNDAQLKKYSFSASCGS